MTVGWKRDLRSALAFAIAYLAASELGYLPSLGPAVGASFWPPSGVALAVFAASRKQRWPWLLSAGLTASLVSDLAHGQRLSAATGFATANLLDPIIGAWILQRAFWGPIQFTRLREVIGSAFVATVISAPVSSLIGAGAGELWTGPTPGFATTWLTWWAGNAVGTIVLAPAVARAVTHWRDLLTTPWRVWLERSFFFIILIGVTELAFSASSTSLAMPFLVFPVLLWASLRTGIAGVGVALFVVVVLATHDTASGYGPFAEEHLLPGERLVALQVYIGVMALCFNAIAVMWEERSHVLAELELARSGLEARYRRLLEQAPLGVLTLRADGSYRESNPAWDALWGNAFPQQILNPASDKVELRKPFLRALEGELAPLPDVELPPLASGTPQPRWLRGFAYPVKSSAGVVEEVVFVQQNVTAEVTAKHQLIAANDQLTAREQALHEALRGAHEARLEREGLLKAERAAREEALRAARLKDDFLAMLSHELRTPLSAVLGWLELLKLRAGDPAILARGLEVIERNANAQLRLVEDLLDMSRILEGKLGIAAQPVSLSEIARSAVETLRPMAQKKEVALTFERDGNDLLLIGDELRLLQVITNIGGNAIKFTPRLGTVNVRLRAEAETAVLTVTDTGQGIAPDFLPLVFERFHQADSGRARRHGGLGLGLTITKHIVENHGGTIAASSEGSGRGATFTVTLPLTADTRALPSAVKPLAIEGLAGTRVLVVDDEDDVRELLRRVLGDHGFIVETAQSAAGAIDLMTKANPDIVITDIGMPETDGFQLLKLLRTSTGSATPAIAVTAFVRQEDRERCLAAGFASHLGKPLDVSALLREITRVLGERRPPAA